MKKFVYIYCLIISVLLSLGAYADDIISMSSRPHKVTLLNHGLASLEVRLQMIERAKKTIDVEYFIYRTDKSAKILTQALVKKAREGVKVRMLLDYFMVKNDLSPFYAHELEAEGIEIKYYNTVSIVKVFAAQYRNHRKLILIDDKEVITGGRNIGDEYFDLHSDYNFLDRDILLEGALVSPIKDSFNQIYNSMMSASVARKKMPRPDDPEYRRGDQENYHAYDIEILNWKKSVADAQSFLESPVDPQFYEEVRTKGKLELSRMYRGVCKDVSFISENPNLGKLNKKSFRSLKYDIFNRINNAKESITMESPYYIINDELGANLDDALKRNIEVKALTNSLNSSDAPYVYAAFDTIIPKWLKKGLDAYVFIGSKPDYYSVLEDQSGNARFGVHAKTIIFDHKDVMIGTYNIDPRSANYNSEMNIICENNPEFAAVVEDDIKLRMESSINLDTQARIKEAEFNQVTFGKRIIYYLSKGISYGFGFLL